METTQVKLDSDTQRTVQALTARMECSADVVVREAVRCYAASANGMAAVAAPTDKSPEDELAINVPMPFQSSRRVQVTIVRRATIIPNPILPNPQETP